MNINKTAALLLTRMSYERVMAEAALARLKQAVNVQWKKVEELDTETCREIIRGADAVITCWGTSRLTGEILDAAPGLKIIAHAAGTVKPVVSEEVWKRGIRVTTTAPAIAISVAHFTIGLMLTQSIGATRLSAGLAQGGWPKTDEIIRLRGLHNITVGLIGAGFVGRKVIEMLKPFDVEILLFDPTLPVSKVGRLGARKVSLEELAKDSDIISVHAPSIPETRHMINGAILSLVKKDALLINTSRGSLIDEKALIAWLKDHPDAFACLDVTDPEPTADDSPFRTMKNVLLTPHIAGLGANTRQGEYAVTEVLRVLDGKKPLYEVTEKMLAKMA